MCCCQSANSISILYNIEINSAGNTMCERSLELVTKNMRGNQQIYIFFKQKSEKQSEREIETASVKSEIAYLCQKLKYFVKFMHINNLS